MEPNLLYLNISKDLHDRFILFFQVLGLEVNIVTKDLIKVNCDLKQFDEIVKTNPIPLRYIERVFPITNSTKDSSEILLMIKEKTIRLVAYPNTFQTSFLSLLDEKGFALSPTKFDYILNIVQLDKEYHYSILKNVIYRKPEEQKHTSRAYYKIKEIIIQTKIDFKDKLVFDLGAAPGGWCEYLKPIAKKVVAVDPAEVLVSGQNIIHLKQKLEDVIEVLNKYKPNIIICDINRDPEEVLKSILKLNIKGTQMIFTLKFNRDNKKYIDQRTEKIKKILEPYSKYLKVFWLFANTGNERTFLCHFK